MPQVLYRKYRPKTFEEVEGQEHVVQTLKGALLSGRVGHAYLFCGPRGTGKTTMARLLAKVLNCGERNSRQKTKKLEVENGKSEVALAEPCNNCGSCNEINENRSLDLIEIDAASNRGIDEVRNIRESAMVAAASGGYKIFLVDEVHMLTTPAFNALLKILEEPPAHVIFILATTEPHKLLETILSRVQRFDFRKLSSGQIAGKLTRIVKTEKININEPALSLIVSAASGSLRDAESILSKIASHDIRGAEITEEEVAALLGIIPSQVHQNLLNLIINKKSGEALAEVTKLYEGGVDIENFAKQFIKYVRGRLMEMAEESMTASPALQDTSDGPTPEFLIKVINSFVRASKEARFSPIPQLPVELAILESVK